MAKKIENLSKGQKFRFLDSEKVHTFSRNRNYFSDYFIGNTRNKASVKRNKLVICV